jgi:hypothetical protein
MQKHEYRVDRFVNGHFVEQLKVMAKDPRSAVRKARALYPNSEIRESEKDSTGVYIKKEADKENGDTI